MELEKIKAGYIIKLSIVNLLFLITINAKSMTAKEFYIYWVDFIEQKIISEPNWTKWYNDNKHWTEHTIGIKESKSGNSPFGKYISDIKKLRYRREDGLTDLSFSDNDYFKNVVSLHENVSERKPVINDSTYYPPCFEILVEHENEIYYCYEEMVKLTYDRARLKVLITYNEDVDGTSDYLYVYKILTDNFSAIISQANKKYPENKDTEYLLIIGQIENKSLVWNSYVFDSAGELKH